jgi:hypothetical protein
VGRAGRELLVVDALTGEHAGELGGKRRWVAGGGPELVDEAGDGRQGGVARRVDGDPAGRHLEEAVELVVGEHLR